jgi:hypothetical protein
MGGGWGGGPVRSVHNKVKSHSVGNQNICKIKSSLPRVGLFFHIKKKNTFYNNNVFVFFFFLIIIFYVGCTGTDTLSVCIKQLSYTGYELIVGPSVFLKNYY